MIKFYDLGKVSGKYIVVKRVDGKFAVEYDNGKFLEPGTELRKWLFETEAEAKTAADKANS